MNAYEQIIKTMRQQGSINNPATMQIAEMESAETCTVGELTLEKDDVLVAEHLKTGYMKDNDTKIKPLKKGDVVLVQRISEEMYIIIERLVEL